MNFHRIKSPEQRLIERGDADVANGDPAGRAALFSAAARRPLHDTPLGLAVHCSRCGATSTLDLVTALRSVLPLFLVAPWRHHGVFAICPEGQHRAWLRVQREA